MGDIEDVYQAKDGINITSRGFRVYQAIMEDLLAKGMKNADNAILSGGSAGGLATILRCDGFRALLPNASGGIAKFLPKSCTSRMRAPPCFFPENLIEDIPTPLFILESSFDAYQIWTGLKQKNYNDTVWEKCATKLKGCTPDQLQNMKDLRSGFLDTMGKIDYSSSRGMFVHSCLTHTHFLNSEAQGWTGMTRPY